MFFLRSCALIGSDCYTKQSGFSSGVHYVSTGISYETRDALIFSAETLCLISMRCRPHVQRSCSVMKSGFTGITGASQNLTQLTHYT